MKKTLLELVQSILTKMDGDEVNSIDDTLESLQVADIVRDTALAMWAKRDWPHLRKTLKFEASASANYPVHIQLPDNVKKMSFINYNKVKQGDTKKLYKPVSYLEPEAFLRRQNALNSDNDNVDVIQDYTGVELLIRTDKAPEYYTSFDDKNIVFDSFDSDVDTTIQNSKIQAMAYTLPSWTHADNYVPDFPEEAFPALYHEALSVCQFTLRQFNDQKAEQEASSQHRWLSRQARNIKQGVKYPDYGRRSAKMRKDPTFKQGRE